jgi:hypothetical protein
MALNFTFSNDLFEWRGPAPFYFVAIPQEISDDIKSVAKELSYGWGVIPVTVTIAKVEFTTSLFPKDGAYLLPVKDMVRKKAGIELGDNVLASLRLGR